MFDDLKMGLVFVTLVTLNSFSPDPGGGGGGGGGDHRWMDSNGIPKKLNLGNFEILKKKRFHLKILSQVHIQTLEWTGVSRKW